MPERTCERCGTSFHVAPSVVVRGSGRWCSWDCYRPPFHIAVWDRVVVADCWTWTGPVTHDGYGAVAAEHGGLVHRAIWMLLVGPIPDGLTLDHLCRNIRCVNPDHLEVVTNRENVLRGYGPTAVNARKTHCVRGHPLRGPGSDVSRASGGGRRCNHCVRIRNSARPTIRRARAC